MVERQPRAMTPWQRFAAAARFGSVDRVPVALLGTARFYASCAGVDQSELYYDPSVLIRAELAVFRRFPEVTFIPGCWPDYGVGFFSAFGMRIEWPDGQSPSLRDRRYGSVRELEAMELPDPARDGLWPWYLRTLCRFAGRREEFGDQLHFLWSMGPGELASYLYGLTGLMELFALEPEALGRVLTKTTDVTLLWLDAQRRVLQGAEAVLLTDDIAGLVSPSMYQDLLLPHHRRIRDAHPDLLFVYHNDTPSDHLLRLIAETGFDVFHLGDRTSLGEAKRLLHGRMALMGNIDPIGALQHGSVEDLERECRRCLDTAAGGGGFVLSAGGGMNAGVAAEKIDAIVRTCRSYTPPRQP